MNFNSQANPFLLALSAYHNLPLIQLGEDSRATATIGRLKIFFGPSECRHYLLSQIPITNLPQDHRRSGLLRQLAASNYSSSGVGGILGLEKSTGLIWLTYRFHLKREKPENFLMTVAIQSGLADYWLNTVVNSPKPIDYPMI
ncbi:MAG: type III secretion system chaperone [Deltaproteobacteria bacterium]|jgi:hypothetical protein|nr:type III secretion system chaperone [Deltaproteobacteria bacterium]